MRGFGLSYKIIWDFYLCLISISLPSVETNKSEN